LLSWLPASWAAETSSKPFQLGVILSQQEGMYKPMSCESLNEKVQGVLRKYYNGSLGGEEHWKRLESLIIKGEIALPDGQVVEFTSNRKKPDLCKTVLKLDRGFEIISSFDGADAWQRITYETEEPVDMPAEIALDYIRDSVFGSHLLYPELPGKKIIYLGEARIGGSICYRLQVTLPNGQFLVMAIDIETGLQVAQEYVSEVDGKERRLIQSDFRKIAGVLIPFRIETYAGEELQEVTTLTSVEANRGLAAWMFQRR
jgi:hypothetical protein